jgi:predicted transcriptional regulator
LIPSSNSTRTALSANVPSLNQAVAAPRVTRRASSTKSSPNALPGENHQITEFMAEFEMGPASRKLSLYILPPRSLKLNSGVEWRNQTGYIYGRVELPDKLDEIAPHGYKPRHAICEHAAIRTLPRLILSSQERGLAKTNRGLYDVTQGGLWLHGRAVKLHPSSGRSGSTMVADTIAAILCERGAPLEWAVFKTMYRKWKLK